MVFANDYWVELRCHGLFKDLSLAAGITAAPLLADAPEAKPPPPMTTAEVYLAAMVLFFGVITCRPTPMGSPRPARHTTILKWSTALKQRHTTILKWSIITCRPTPMGSPRPPRHTTVLKWSTAREQRHTTILKWSTSQQWYAVFSISFPWCARVCTCWGQCAVSGLRRGFRFAGWTAWCACVRTGPTPSRTGSTVCDFCWAVKS